MLVNRVSDEIRPGYFQSVVLPKFYRHPERDDLLLTPDGVCRTKNCCVPIPLYINKAGYLVCKIDNHLHLHRLMAETFLKSDGEKTVVNHKDGVKTNPSVFNLEWCTTGYNNDHAYETGLRDDNVQVDVRNLETGEITNCRSICKAAELIGVNQGKVSTYLKRGLNRQYVINSIYEIKRPSDKWILTKNSIGKNYGQGAKGVVVNKVGDNRYFLFNSAPHAAEYIGVKPHMIYSHLNNGSVNLNKYGYDACYLVDTEIPITEMFDMRIEKPAPLQPRKPPKMVEVFDTVTGKKGIYNSLREFCTTHGFNKTNVERRVYERGGYKHYTIRYI